MTDIPLSILDQSPVVEGRTPQQAIAETMDLVTRADELGYKRYWFAEHHGSASFASASPTVMMANAAARTKQIRLGSGGILMGHARPLEVVENIRTLEALAPGRIDLGMGRAPGGDQRVMQALGYKPQESVDRIKEVLRMLRDERVASNGGDIVAVPDSMALPEIWILGTSPESARVAGELGLPYAFGSFIDPTHINEALGMYFQSFTPSAYQTEPKLLVATVVFCADTESEADSIMQSSEKWFVRSFLRRENLRFPHNDAPLTMTDQEQFIAGYRRRTVIHGDAESCRQQLNQLQKQTQCSEISVVTITERHEARVRSYELLADKVFA